MWKMSDRHGELAKYTHTTYSYYVAHNRREIKILKILIFSVVTDELWKCCQRRWIYDRRKRRNTRHLYIKYETYISSIFWNILKAFKKQVNAAVTIVRGSLPIYLAFCDRSRRLEKMRLRIQHFLINL